MISTRNIHRVARVKIQGTTIAECKKPPDNGHRISFRCTRTHRSEPSTVSVQIFGLSPERRDQISRAWEMAREQVFAMGDTNQGVIGDVQLEIGYDGALAQLISADVVDIEHEDMFPGTVTTITGQDGGAPWRGSTVNETILPGMSVDLVKTVITQAMQIAFFDADSERAFNEALVGFTRTNVDGGYVLQGPTAKVLPELFESMGLKFSFQNGKAQLVRFDHVKTDKAVLLRPQTGLLRRPKFKSLGRVTLYCQANPLLEPGRQVDVRDEFGVPHGAGLFRVDSADSTGDTHGGAWETVVEASSTKIGP